MGCPHTCEEVCGTLLPCHGGVRRRGGVDKRTLRFAAHANKQQFGTLVFSFIFLSPVALFVVCVPAVQSLLFSCTCSICQLLYRPRICSHVVAVLVTVVFFKDLPDKMPTFLRSRSNPSRKRQDGHHFALLYYHLGTPREKAAALLMPAPLRPKVLCRGNTKVIFCVERKQGRKKKSSGQKKQQTSTASWKTAAVEGHDYS
jgi:hypothetical protein